MQITFDKEDIEFINIVSLEDDTYVRVKFLDFDQEGCYGVLENDMCVTLRIEDPYSCVLSDFSREDLEQAWEEKRIEIDPESVRDYTECMKDQGLSVGNDPKEFARLLTEFMYDHISKDEFMHELDVTTWLFSDNLS